ncbi:MAG: serine/threonine protein kinase [Glaciihabitans sp.]|nr:serine/threonine protein kinase [Glaciihabitans sp.]
MPVPTTDATDRILGGRYWLESVIGQGGMATVYQARDEVLGRHVAVKFFHHASSIDTSRQESELAVLASLNHHGLVNLFDAGVDTDNANVSRRYLVMELVRGTDLRTRLDQGPISARHIAEIGYDLAEALEYVHTNGVVHRDIKPSNILLVDYGDRAPRARAKLSDFGIALSEEVERLTREGATTGTAAYLSPEQAAGVKVGKATDVYSLGLVLLECFTRRPEFPGTIVESAVARLSRDPVIPPELPEHWRGLLTAMTARKPANRPPRRELVSALKQILIAESARHKDVDAPLLMPTEGARLKAVTSFGILDTTPDATIDRVTAMAARLLSAPVSIVSIVDQDRIWFKSHHGVATTQIDRASGLFGAAILADDAWVVEDARTDPRTADNALVTGSFGLQFYVAVPLRTSEGHNLGTLSVIDYRPRRVTDDEIANLHDLAAIVIAQLELRREGLRFTGEFGGDSIRTTLRSTVRTTGEHAAVPIVEA